MIDRKLNGTFVCDVGYNDYIAVIGCMDAEWTRAEGPNKPFRHGCGDFISACKQYGANVRGKYNLFCECKANHISQPKPMDNYLFNPACYIPFGHADGLIITLLDDFDPVHHITAQLKTTLEEICLAFCPTLRSIGVLNDKQIFCELHTLLDDNLGDLANTDLEHDFQKETPLLVFTKYKMDGLSLLGEGLLFQQALFKAMAQKIHDTITLLGEQCKNRNDTNALILPKDVETFKCSFLDLQGAEEIGTLMFCRNYSVAMTVIATLRTLTFDDVLKESTHVEKALNNSKTHLSVIKIGKIGLDNPKFPEDISDIKNHHVFRWTCSSLAVSPQTLISKNYANCNGYAESIVEHQISPGHHSKAEDNIKVVASQGQEYSGVEKYHRYQAGVGDVIFAYSPSEERTKFPLMPISSVFSLAYVNDSTFGDSDKIWEYGRDIIDVKTNMVIPVPKNFANQKPTHHSLLVKVLRQIQNRLCYAPYPCDSSIDATHSADESQSGKLSIDKLEKIPRLYVLPLSLGRSIEHLYQDFAICIADPFLFDMVLDFYDVFAALHGVLTNYLPQILKVDISKNESGKVIDQETVYKIAVLVDVISSAFARRMSKVHPEPQIRDMSIDFRGGLNQMLLAADVPLRSGFGLVRKFAILKGTPDRKDKLGRKDMIGSVTRISFTPGAHCYSSKLGVEDNARLAFFEMDVPHVLHIASYCDCLHEAAHLIYYGLLENTNSPIYEFRSKFSNVIMQNRIEEIFANLITHMFIFGSDTAKFLRYKLDNYTKGQINTDEEERNTKVTFALFVEELIRLFFVIDAIPSKKKPKHWKDTWVWKEDSADSAAKRFDDMVECFGPIFSEYQRLNTCKFKEQMRNYRSREFKDIYAEVREFMPGLWSEAMRIYTGYTGSFVDYNKNTYDCYDEEVNKIIEAGLNHGRPIAQSQYYPNADNSISSDKSDSSETMCAGVDPLMLVCKLLYQYIPPFEEMKGKAIHLYRTSKERCVEYPVQYLNGKELPWYEFQIDRGAPALFCPVPIARRKRLQKQIVIIKSFWGLSSSMRLRRLEEIIDDNWPELS
jgi:hypothetical protein